MNLIASNDGIEFINTYSKGKTTLSRDLSNFANSPFTHPKLGYFQSVEAAWYYIYTGCLHDNLRKIHGSKAKIEGRKKIPPEWKNEVIQLTDEFKEKILECIQCKLRQNKHILMALIATDLPLVHFYANGNRIQNKPEYNWALIEMDRIRKVTQKWYIQKYGALPNIPLVFID
jgi:hypothetical protein